MARPKKYNIDTEQVEKLAGLGCSNTEIASFFDVGEHVIRKVMPNFLKKVETKAKSG